MPSMTGFNSIVSILTRLASPEGKISRFSYTQQAYDMNEIEGVAAYDFDQEQNIPLQTATDTHETVLDKGVRAQGASITRQFQNHFLGRMSFNVNKLIDNMLTFISELTTFFSHDAFEYNETVPYSETDICFTVTQVKDQLVYTWWQRVSVTPQTIVGIPPPNAQHWQRMRERSSVADDLAIGTNLQAILKSGLYTANEEEVYESAVTGPAGVPTSPFTLRVYGDADYDVQIVQELLFSETGVEWTRILGGAPAGQAGPIIVDWYKTKDPNPQLVIPPIEDDLFVLAIDPADGHLYVYYSVDDQQAAENEAPPLYIETDVSTGQYGHLIWAATPGNVDPNG